MSKRDRNHRRALIALAIIVFGAVVAGAFGFLEQAKREACKEERSACDNGGYDAAYNGWRDSYAQWSMAALALIGAGLSGATLLLLYRTIQETRLNTRVNLRSGMRQVRETRRIGEAQAKAYLACTRASYGMTEETFWVSIFVKNFGQSPAVRATVTGTWVHIKFLAASMEYYPMGSGAIGPVVTTMEESTVVSLSRDKMTDRGALGEAVTRRGIPVIIDCRLEWETVFGTTEVIHFALVEKIETTTVEESEGPGRLLVRKGTLEPGTQDERWLRREDEREN